MRISDWSSDVCSSDLTPAASGVNDRDVQLREHVAQDLGLFAEHRVELAGIAVALDAPQAGALDGLDDGGLAETEEEGGPGLDADAVPRARAVGRQTTGVLRGALGIGIGLEIGPLRGRSLCDAWLGTAAASVQDTQ